ncbi:MAG: PIN domain-containing protein [Armatimonadetes bacterium]|nr:PIN domain-containing protein [Armatimonadota bacterium]
MDGKPFALLDACLLYSATMRDLLMRLTIRLAFQPKWTERIHTEWIENLLHNRSDLTRVQVERTRDLMNRNGRDYHVPEYETLIPALNLPDENDRHILAAAIACECPTIVTFNLSDFPARTLREYNIRAIHPDVFLCELFDDDPPLFVAAVRDQIAGLTHPSQTIDDLLIKLRNENLAQLTRRLEEYREEF